MLKQPTIDKLLAMRMEPMVEAWRGFERDETMQAQLRRKTRADGRSALDLAPECSAGNGGYAMPNCAATPAWRTSTTVRLAASTARLCVRWAPTAAGCNDARTFSLWGQPESARVSQLVPWHRKLAVTATWCCTPVPLPCSGT